MGIGGKMARRSAWLAALLLLACSGACAAPVSAEDQTADLSPQPVDEATAFIAEVAGNSTNSAGNNTAPAPAPVVQPAKSEGKKDKKPSTMRGLKINAYIKKIKEFQKIKKQRWDPADEQKLAGQLVDIDELMKSTTEQKAIEKKLRVGPPGYRVELSLKKYDEEKEERKKEKKAAEKKTKQAIRDKKEKDAAAAREEKDITAQIQKYHETALAGKLGKKLKKAKLEYNQAVMTEKKHKGTPSVKAFRKKYGLDKPAEKEPDYPKDAAAAPQKTAAAQKAPAAAQKAAAPTAKPAAPTAKPAAAKPELAESKDQSDESAESDAVDNSVAAALREANTWPSN